MIALLAVLACTPPRVEAPPRPVPAPDPSPIACSVEDCCWVDEAGGVVCIDAEPGVRGARGLESSEWWTCALTDDGPECWGDASRQPLTAEVPARPVADLALGTAGGVALEADGGMAPWGSDVYGQISDAPAGAFVDVEAGYGWACAIDDGGELSCWGILGGEGVGWIAHDQADAPAARFAELDRGCSDTLCGRTLDGRWLCWGDVDAELVDAVDVAPADGVVCAAYDDRAECSDGVVVDGAFSDLACGWRMCCALPGPVCWGDF